MGFCDDVIVSKTKRKVDFNCLRNKDIYNYIIYYNKYLLMSNERCYI